MREASKGMNTVLVIDDVELWFVDDKFKHALNGWAELDIGNWVRARMYGLSMRQVWECYRDGQLKLGKF